GRVVVVTGASRGIGAEMTRPRSAANKGASSAPPPGLAPVTTATRPASRPMPAEDRRGNILTHQERRRKLVHRTVKRSKSDPVGGAMSGKPAVSLVGVAGRRRATVELAQRIEREGFTGIYCPSPGDGLGLCEALAVATREIALGTSIANIYTRH